jgi:hypothetical protein
VVCGLTLHAIRGSAQEPVATADPGGAVVTGVVVDSIRGGYMRGASVFVSGTALSAVTDSLGRFRIVGIPAGTRVMEIQHPLLDSLALPIQTPPRAFTNGDSSFIVLTLPSASTLVALACPAEERAKGPAMIIGTVIDGASGGAAAGSSVSVSWIDYVVGKKSITSTLQRRVAAVSPTGNFRICGLPDDLVASVVASRGNDSTAAINVNLSSIIGIVSLRLPAPRTDFARDSATAVGPSVTASISGRVVDAAGKPAAGARVAIEADDAVAITAPDGTFTLARVRPGTRPISVRKIGFEPLETSVDLRSEGITDLRLSLGRSVAVLRQIVVRARQEGGLQRVGFADRKAKRPGNFISPNDVELRNGPRLGELLRPLPVMRRPGCVRYFIDGWLQSAGSNPDEYLSGFEIGAVEVYSSQFAPPEFYSYSRTGGNCTSVVVWTKWKLR